MEWISEIQGRRMDVVVGGKAKVYVQKVDKTRTRVGKTMSIEVSTTV